MHAIRAKKVGVRTRVGPRGRIRVRMLDDVAYFRGCNWGQGRVLDVAHRLTGVTLLLEASMW